LKRVFFTDLDGTLLDHDTYDFSPALPALSALKSLDIPLVLASSKTGPELIAIRSALGFEHCPAIIENGAGELSAGEVPTIDNRSYRQLRTILNQLPVSLRNHFKGFGDMSLAEVVAVTGLPEDAAQLAQQRAFTEPGIFSGTADDRWQFLAALAEHRVSARDGGRFLTLSLARNNAHKEAHNNARNIANNNAHENAPLNAPTKADALRAIAKRMRATETIALGDAPNDLEMLQAASIAVVVRNDHAPPMDNIDNAIYTDLPGPAGWNAAVLSLLAH